jgi:hypothetical protein
MEEKEKIEDTIANVEKKIKDAEARLNKIRDVVKILRKFLKK